MQPAQGFTLFRKMAFNKRDNELKDYSLECLQQWEPGRYEIADSGLFGKSILASEQDGVKFFYTYKAFTRPWTYILVALLPESTEPLLPGIKPADFVHLVQILGLNKKEDIIALKAVSDHQYGTAVKNVLPALISSHTDAHHRGFSITDDTLSLNTSSCMLAWQMWGGILYTFTYNAFSSPLIVSTNVLSRYKGNYEPLPKGETR